MTAAIIFVFIVGYILVALESLTRISKTAVALLMAVICWVLYYMGFGATPENISTFTKSLGETSEILFFLLGAMVIVEVVDTNGGFDFVREKLYSATKKTLLWKLTFMTFFLSSVLDNMTTAIVMIMVLNKLISDDRDKLLYSSMVILAANSGGAFSPIGDVTTIMLWVKGNISTFGVIRFLLIPSFISIVVPGLIMGRMLKGELVIPEAQDPVRTTTFDTTSGERWVVFITGVGGLLFVPIFRLLTDLPPFMGILMILSLLWIVTEFIFKQKKYKDIPHDRLPDVSALLHKIDISTILFFLGILTAVSALAETGSLKRLGDFLDASFDGNPYIVTTIIGFFSAIVDNVPLVASCMGMYDVATVQEIADLASQNVAVYGMDGTFWLLLAYCAGIGGSMLVIGSAAGVVVMGLQNISFGWYLKHFSWIACLGYLSGILVFWLQELMAI